MTKTIDYEAYLLSDAWKTLSDETKRLAGNRCQVCYSDDKLHAHHRTYLRIGRELQSDLIALCAHCHALFHGKVDSPREIERLDNAPLTKKIFIDLDAPLPLPTPPQEPRHILISMRPCGDALRDIRRTQNVFRVLTSSQGKDTFSFKIYEDDDKFQIVDFPDQSTHINEESLTRISRLIGSRDYEITRTQAAEARQGLLEQERAG